MPLMSFDHHPSKCLEVLIFTEQAHSPNRPVQNVIDKASRCSSGGFRHEFEADLDSGPLSN